MSRSARIRTLSGGFGDRLLSQEHAPIQGVRGESNPPPRPSQGPMPNHYTTDTISSPGWIRTSDLSHVTGMCCPLNEGTAVPRPGFEPGTPRSKRGMMVRFTIGASSGRQGSRTLISVGRTALAERPGQPYPATFHSVDPPGIEPGFPVCQTGVVPLDHEPAESGEWGSNPRFPAPKAGGLPLSYPLSGAP